MTRREARRTTRELSADELARIEEARQQIAQELPQLIARDQLRKDASEELTLSGELRRAIHSSDLSLSAIADKIGVTPIFLDDFLTGERTLRSDVLDRLANVLGCRLETLR